MRLLGQALAIIGARTHPIGARTLRAKLARAYFPAAKMTKRKRLDPGEGSSGGNKKRAKPKASLQEQLIMAEKKCKEEGWGAWKGVQPKNNALWPDVTESTLRRRLKGEVVTGGEHDAQRMLIKEDDELLARYCVWRARLHDPIYRKDLPVHAQGDQEMGEQDRLGGILR